MRTSPIPRMVGASVAAVGQLAEQAQAVVDQSAGIPGIAGIPANDGQPMERRGLTGPEPGLPRELEALAIVALGDREVVLRPRRGGRPPGALGTPRGGRRAHDGSRRPRWPGGRRARCPRTGWRGPRARRAPARAPVSASSLARGHGSATAGPRPGSRSTARTSRGGRPDRAPGRDPPTGSDPARPAGCRARSRADRTSSARPVPTGRHERPRRWPGPRWCGPTRPTPARRARRADRGRTRGRSPAPGSAASRSRHPG